MDKILGHDKAFPAAVRKRVLQRQDYRCYYCGTSLKGFKGRKRQVHIDHRTPPDRGGSNDEDNLAATCQTCNTRKGNRTIWEYRRYLVSRSLVWWTALLVGRLLVEHPELRRMSVGRLLMWAGAYPLRYRFPGEVAEQMVAEGAEAMTEDPRAQAAMPPTELTLINLSELKRGRG